MNLMQKYLTRGGCNSDPEIDAVESQIADQAYQVFMSDPGFHRKGLKWTYNYFHFHTFYGATGPLLNLMLQKRPYPTHIEVECTTFCDLRCIMCENTYMKEKRQNMSYKDFLKIMAQFPDLKQMGLTGIGNSTCNPDYWKMLQYCNDKDIAVEIFHTFKDMTKDRDWETEP